MKANELMLGDLVTFKDCQFDNPVPIKMIAIGYQDGEENCLVQINGNDVCDIIEVDDEIVGIPLTPEILEKNGLEKQSNYQWKYRDNSCKIVISIAPQIKINGEMLGASPVNVMLEGALFDINITSDCYVHILQHCFRLVGIDREITI